jgi:hypothetical protein
MHLGAAPSQQTRPQPNKNAHSQLCLIYKYCQNSVLPTGEGNGFLYQHNFWTNVVHLKFWAIDRSSRNLSM